MSSIRIKRSAQPGKAPAAHQLQLGELALNTHDGQLFFRRDQDGNSIIRQVGAREDSENVYYVTVNGSDSNDGKTIGDAFATLTHALKVVPERSTIYLKSGTHVVDNPAVVPAFVAIVGDSLRTTIVKGKHRTKDIFWVKNGAFIKDLRISGHEAPAAGVAFPVGGNEAIYTSPYVQNCTSDTSTGTGMRIDGNDVTGLKSMVVDAYTQYNQGGIGIHHLNGGNTQLVSVFTICCDISILCESGGFCSLTNSNTSFGNKGLVSDGISELLYKGSSGVIKSPNSLIINDLRNVPYVQNTVKFSGSDEFYNVLDATPLKIGEGVIVEPNFDSEDSNLVSARLAVLDSKSVIQKDTIDHINSEFPQLNYNQSKCFRDVGLIIEAAIDDMVFGTNYKTVVAARSYYRASAGFVISDQQTETIAAINFAKAEVLDLLTEGTLAYTRVAENFDVVTNVIQNGLGVLPAIVFPNPTGVLPEVERAKNHLVNNRAFFIAEAIAFVTEEYPELVYDQATCERDVGYIIDAATYDMLYKGNTQSYAAGIAYYSRGLLQIPEEQKAATSDVAGYFSVKINDVFRSNAVLSFQSAVPQDTSETESTLSEINRASALFGIVQSVIRSGFFIDDFIFEQSQTFSGQGELALEIREIILSNKESLQFDTIKFINDNFSEFEYNEEICFRDVGFIIESIAMDVALGTNYNAIVSGLAYQRANLAIDRVKSTQFVQTLNAIKFVKERMLMLNLSETAKDRISSSFDIVIEIFQTNTVPEGLDLPVPTVVDSNLVAAKDQLLANKEFIKAEIIARINEIYQNFEYDEDKCIRDLGLILDAILLDTVLNTDYNSIRAGESYYRANASDVLTGQKIQTLGALREFRRLIESIESISGTPRLRLLSRLDLIIDIIDTGNLNEVINYVKPPIATQGMINSHFLLLNNKTFIQKEVIAYVNEQFPSLEYDEEKCERDVGYIVDALTFDILYGGTSATTGVAQSYFVGALGQLGTGEAAATIDAYTHLKQVTNNVIQNILMVRTLGNNESQIISTDSGTSNEISELNALIDLIIGVIQDDGLENLPAAIVPDFSWADASFRNTYTQVDQRRDTLISETIQFINSQYTFFDYDQEKCKRDLDLIIDALALDASLTTNYNSLTAGSAYYRANASVVIGVQKEATLVALQHLREIIEQSRVISIDFKKIVLNLHDEIINILDTGTPTQTLIYGNPTDATVGKIRAKESLIANRGFIKDEVIAYIEDNFIGFEYTQPIQEKCERDLGFIIEAAQYDAVFGTNYNAITAGLAYQRENAATVEADQLLQTVAAIRRARDLTVSNMLSITGANRATDAFDTVIDLLLNKPIDTSLIFVDPVGADPLRISAKDSLVAARSVIKNNISTYLENNFETVWNGLGAEGQARCTRDVGFIIDAVSYDILYGGNTASIRNADAYWVGAANQLGSNSDEVTATLAAYEELKSIIANNIDPSLVTVTDGLIEIIREHINNGGTTDFTQIIELPSILWTSNELQADFATIESETSAIISSTSDFIIASFNNFSYDSEKCKRDVGLIVDGLIHDVLYGGNYATVRVADSYFVGTMSQLGEGEAAATVAAYDYLKLLISDVIQNVPVTPTNGHDDQLQDTITAEPATESEVLAVSNLLDIIVDVIYEGNLNTLSKTIFPSLSWTTPDVRKDFSDLRAEKAKLISNTISFINKTFRGFDYDQLKCSRDVGYIVEALAYDILYGGNSAARRIALSYFSQFEGTRNISQLGAGEKEATIDSYEYLTDIIGKIVQNQTVDPTTGNEETQDTSSSSATSTEANRLADLINLTIDVLKAGTANNVPAEIFPDISWIGVELTNDVNLIRNRKVLIQTGTIDFINERYTEFSYDPFKCSRDVGLILDAVTDDMVLKTNYKSIVAGSSYYRMSASKVIDEQLLETIEAVKFLKENALKLIEIYEMRPEFTDLSDRFDDVIAILTEGISDLPAIDFNRPAAATQEQVNAVAILQANKEFFIEEAVAFIREGYPMLGYDRDLCERDVGLIIDALGYDLMFGSNFRTITAGRSYYRKGSEVVIESQKEATLASYALLRELAINIVSGSAAKLSIRNNMDLLIDIIENGLTVVPEAVLPEPTGYSDGFRDARDLIEANREFIKAETIAFIADQFSELNYDEAACLRDIDYILDAVRYDLTYGGNMETIIAANAYYSGGVLQLGDGEEAATLAAYQFLEGLIEEVAQNITVDPTQQNEVSQVSGTAGSLAAAQTASGLINDIRVVINTPNDPPSTVLASTAWVSSTLIASNDALQAQKSSIQTQITEFIEAEFAYKESVCRRDVGLITDALCYDVLYGGNTQINHAAKEYFSGGVLQIPEFTLLATRRTFSYLRSIADDSLLNVQISALQQTESQVTNLDPASGEVVDLLDDKFKVLINLLTHGYSSIVTFDVRMRRRPTLNEVAEFYQPSLITASGHTFEWVGAGVNINSALPYEGGQPVEENQVIEINNGRVYFTSTDQSGDFKIGPELTIERASGTITGEAFDRSLFAVLTPYILSLQ